MKARDFLDSKHELQLKGLLFGSSKRNLGWLERQAWDCRTRYGGLKLIPQFRSAINAFSDSSAKPFELFVLGEGKFGKSTLVNALLGEERSTVRGLPETRCFLRYEITDCVDRNVQMFMRLKPGLHDWIEALVGRGAPVSELYEILQYSVSGALATQILAQEAKRMDHGGYEAAIFEAQRFVPLTERTAFPAGVRIVDTQGLDQLFPEDLQHIGRQTNDSSTTSLFLDWMSNTPRGKHLEWQYRRCDAVLWCINAKRLGSAATDASLRYFSSYSKRIVIALTNLDLVARKESDRQRILDRANQKYGQVASKIIPVNGAEALQSVLANDALGVERSGLLELKEALVDACVRGGAMTRGISRYLGLRQTETQFRMALRQIKKDLIELEKKHKDDLQSLATTLDRTKKEFAYWVDSECDKLVSTIHLRIQNIDLSDDSFTARNKIRADEEVDRLALNAQDHFGRSVRQRAQGLGSSITPYSIPRFDAEGNVDGHLRKVHVDPQIRRAPSVGLSLYLSLDNEIFYRAALWFRKKVLGIVSSQARHKAEMEELRAIETRRASIRAEFDRQWRSVKDNWTQQLSKATDDIFKPIRDEVNRVMHEVESLEGEPIRDSIERISEALSYRASNSVYMSQFVRAARAR